MKTKPRTPKRARVVHVEVKALFNLGNYQNITYGMSAEVPAGGSARQTLIDLQWIIGRLRPIRKPDCEAEYEQCSKTPEGERTEWQKNHSQEWAERMANYHARVAQQSQALRLLDEIGGKSEYRDAKAEWENEDDTPF